MSDDLFASDRLSFDEVYLSPHLDDAALSCGGRIFDQARAGKTIGILTLCTAAPAATGLSSLARDLHQRWGLDAATVMDRRQREDADACRVLGAEPVHGRLLDALYRRHPQTGRPLYPTLESLFGTPDPAEDPLLSDLAGQLRQRVRAARVHAPLAVGNHVDHQLTRRAAERAFGPELRYYEDFPYARRRRALWRALTPRRRWTSTVWPLGRDALEHKIRAISCYPSQLGTVFEDAADLRRQVEGFARRRGGERLWRRLE